MATDAPVYPVSKQQQLLLSFLSGLHAPGGLYNLAGAVRVPLPVHAGALRQAAEDVVARHEILRTTFVSTPPAFAQRVLAPGAVHWEERDASCTAPADRTRHILDDAADEARSRFVWTEEPLLRIRHLRFAADDHAIVVGTHHLVFDGVSAVLMWNELSAAYGARVVGRTPELPSLTSQYRDYASWQRDDSAAFERDLHWWSRRLHQPPPRLRIPVGSEASDPLGLPGHVRVHVDGLACAQLHDRCRRLRASAFTVMLATLAVRLWSLTGQDDVLLGVSTAHRPPEFRGLIGDFQNLLPLRVSIDPGWSFADLVAAVGRSLFEVMAHGAVMLIDLQEHAGLHLDMQVRVIDRAGRRPQLGEIPGLEVYEGVDNVPMRGDLRVTLFGTGDGLEVRIDHHQRTADRSVAETLAAGMRTTLQAVVADPGVSIERLRRAAGDREGARE